MSVQGGTPRTPCRTPCARRRRPSRARKRGAQDSLQGSCPETGSTSRSTHPRALHDGACRAKCPQGQKQPRPALLSGPTPHLFERLRQVRLIPVSEGQRARGHHALIGNVEVLPAAEKREEQALVIATCTSRTSRRAAGACRRHLQSSLRGGAGSHTADQFTLGSCLLGRHQQRQASSRLPVRCLPLPSPTPLPKPGATPQHSSGIGRQHATPTARSAQPHNNPLWRPTRLKMRQSRSVMCSRFFSLQWLSMRMSAPSYLSAHAWAVHTNNMRAMAWAMQ